jgi:hypothetical protein
MWGLAMSIDAAVRAPARMSIANVSTGDSVEARFNPTELEEALEVNWARQTFPGCRTSRCSS